MKKFFVLGSSIAYTLSPAIHNALYGIFNDDAIYTIKDVPVRDFDEFMNSISGFDGFNVTKPYKERIVKYVNTDLCSVNTVVTDGMRGYSTDGAGFAFDLRRTCGDIKKAAVLVVGYGGAATAITDELKRNACDVYVCGRNADKAAAFAKRRDVSLFSGQKVQFIVNCASGDTAGLPSVEAYYDIRYDCPIPKVGKRNFNGLGMLVAQAIYSYGLFMNKQFDFCDVERLYLKRKELL